MFTLFQVKSAPNPVTHERFAPYRSRQGVFRENIVRQADNVPDPLGRSSGIAIDCLEKAIVENNTFEVGNAHPIRFTKSGATRCQNNTQPSGELFQGFNDDTDTSLDDLATLIEDATLLAL